MAKAHIYLAAGANVEATDTFASWVDTTNSLVYDMGTVVLTSVAGPQPNTSVGGYTAGNSHLQGILSANTMVASDGLRGGTVSATEDLYIVSNTIFNESALVEFTANTNLISVDANNFVISSNVVFDGTTKTITIDVANTTINTGAFYVKSNTIFSGTYTTVQGSDFTTFTDNTTLNGSLVVITAAEIDITSEAAQTLNVDAVSSFNANTDFNANTAFNGNTVNFSSDTTVTAEGPVNTTGKITAVDIDSTGIVNVTNSTDATSTTSAPLKTAGGAAIAKKLYVGGEINASANVTISGTGNGLTTPNLTITNNSQVGGTLTANNLTVTGTTIINTDSQLSLNNATTAHSTVTDDLTLTNATIIGDVVPDVNDTYDIGTGALKWKTIYANNVLADVSWSNITNRPDPVITVTLSGDVAGSGTATLTDLANGSVSISTTVQPNSVALGTDTTGNYVATVAAGTPSTQTGSSGLTISSVSGEGTATTIAHADTSSVANVAVDNSNGTVLQDLSVSFDTFGHVVSISQASTNLDTRYAQTSFSNIAVSGQANVVADATSDTLTFAGGGIVSITTNSTTDTLTITATEADTLATVTSRGNTTTNSITVNDITVTGNLIVSGTTTTVNTETVNIADNIVVLNSNYTGSSPSENSGIEVERGTQANKQLIWDETNDKWTVGSETFVAGAFQGNLDWSYIQSRPDPVVTVTLTGDVTGSSSATLTDLANGTVTIATTVQPNSVALGTDTTGNYVADITAGAYITKSGSAGEGWSPTVAVDATSTNTASKVVARDASGNFSANTTTSTSILVGNTSSTSISVNSTTIQANSLASNSTLNLNASGGNVVIGHAADSTLVNIKAVTARVDGDLEVTGDISSNSSITAAGDVTAYSDERLKSNIRTIDNALDKVASMRGVYFDKDGKASTGVIAQEVEKVLPEVVLDGEYKSVAYGNIVGVLIEAIKELRAEIEDLKRGR